MTRSKLWMLAGAGLLAVAPAIAEENSSSNDEVVKALELETARSNALKARYEAEQAAVTARFAPLQSLAGQGNATRGEGGGQMEAAYLAAIATRSVAELIDGSVRNRAPNREIVLLTADEAFSFDALAAFNEETRGLRAAFLTTLNDPAFSCPSGDEPAPTGDDGTADVFGPGLIPIIGAVAGLLRSDTAVYGLGDLGSHRMIALAVSEARPGTYVLPAALLAPGIAPDNPVNARLAALNVCRASAVRKAAALAPSQRPAAKAQRDAILAVIGRYDAYLAALTTANEGVVRLAVILRQSVLQASDRPVLRVHLERGGGSLVTRKNIWTAFGVPAVTVSGGVVASYLLTEPSTGATLASGTFVCNSGMRDLRAAQRLSDVTPVCNPSMPAAPRPAMVAQTAEVTAEVAADVTDVADGGAEVAPQESPTGEIVFDSVLALRQRQGAASPMLRHGVVATSSEWPASLYALFQTSRGWASCTAALVGPQALLTAAHCIPPGGRIAVKFADRSYGALCERHDDHVTRRDVSADFALCRLDETLAVPAGFRFERISADPSVPMEQMLGQQIVLGGFGCISDAVAQSQTDRRYRIGFNSIVETSSSPRQSRGPRYYSPQQSNNLLTRDDPALANLCPGDSGGPAFRAEPANDGPYGSRSIIGVNSRVFYRELNPDGTPRTYGSSLVSATGGPAFRAWAEAWATQRARVAVCGITGSLPNCRL